jgi:hypothetical protein
MQVEDYNVYQAPKRQNVAPDPLALMDAVSTGLDHGIHALSC